MRLAKRFDIKIPWQGIQAISAATLLLLLLLLRPVQSGEPPPGSSSSIIHTDFSAELLNELSPKCPQIVPRVYSNKVPRGQLGNNQTMQYVSVKKKLGTMDECYSQCCDDSECNMAFMYVNNSKISCYKVSRKSWQM